MNMVHSAAFVMPLVIEFLLVIITVELSAKYHRVCIVNKCVFVVCVVL